MTTDNLLTEKGTSMSRIRSRIQSAAIQQVAEIEGGSSVESSILITTSKILIENNTIVLPQKGYGDIVWNLALIFDNNYDNIITSEASCNMSDDGLTVLFEETDNLNGKYAIVSYLGMDNE